MKIIVSKTNKGITLIALVITIIVLLILAAVSIATLTGENGILTRAQDAKTSTKIAEEREKVELAATAALADDLGGEIKEGFLKQELEEYFGTDGFSIAPGENNGEEGFIVAVTENVEEGRKYFVSQNGSVEEYKESQVSELTDIYVSLYTDGTLIFSNNNQPMEGKTVEESYGNIKDKVFEIKETNGKFLINIPWLQVESTNEEDAMNQLMTKSAKIKEVIIINKIVPKNTNYWFCMLMNIQKINGLENFNTSNITDMSSMFVGCESLTNLDLSDFDTSNVTNMSSMFIGCESLTNLDLSDFDTSNVTNMSDMFVGCESLTNLDLSDFDTSNVTNMSYMFSNCESLTNLDLSNFDTSNVTDMERYVCDLPTS